MSGANYKQDGGLGTLLVLNVGNIAAGAAYTPPANRKIFAVYSADADVIDLRFQIHTGAAFISVRAYDAAADWTGIQNRWNATYPLMTQNHATGAVETGMRLYNSGANQIDNVYILYYDT